MAENHERCKNGKRGKMEILLIFAILGAVVTFLAVYAILSYNKACLDRDNYKELITLSDQRCFLLSYISTEIVNSTTDLYYGSDCVRQAVLLYQKALEKLSRDLIAKQISVESGAAIKERLHDLFKEQIKAIRKKDDIDSNSFDKFDKKIEIVKYPKMDIPNNSTSIKEDKNE